MKNLIIILLFSIMFFGCEKISDPITTQEVKLNKNSITNNNILPYLQEFKIVNSVWNVEGSNIEMKIQNQNLFNITRDYFAIISYENYQLMVYIDKPNKIDFIIPYLGNDQVQNVTLFAIINYIK